MKREPFKFPVILIQNFTPTIIRESKIFSSKVICKLGNSTIEFYDNSGMDLSEFVGLEMEVLFEVTRGRIWYPYKKDVPESAISVSYKWQQMYYNFFPELIVLMENPEELGLKWDEEIESLYDAKAKSTFENWGVKGLGVDIHNSGHFVSSDLGHFMINEYEFEEHLNVWKLSDEFKIDIYEGLLRAIRPYTPKVKIEEELELTEEQKAAKARFEEQQARSRKAVEAMYERIRIRRLNGEGPSLV